jgi:chromosomal replication initiator protein
VGAVEAKQSTLNWSDFASRLRTRIEPAAWSTWIDPLTPSFEDTTLVLLAPNDFHVRWVKDQYLEQITDIVVAVGGTDYKVEVMADPDVAVDLDEPGDEPRAPAPPPIARAPVGIADERSRLIDKYTFENFVVGPSNRFANAAAMAVAEETSLRYNPLFIYGASGLGKTHLLHAVGHHRIELDPSAVVRYVTSEQFFNEFIHGIRNKRMEEFKTRYRTTDVLLLDDVQFFEGKEQILEEFFHTFNSLYEAGKQLVISSDRPPKSLQTIEDRLRSRFEWGLMTDIQPPDVETRLAILRKAVDFAPVAVPMDVLEFIATRVNTNIRELEGALTRVTAFAALNEEAPTLGLADHVLKDVMAPDDAAPVTAERVIAVTAASYHLDPDELIGKSRKQPLARRRQIAMYLCRELTDLSLPMIGDAFGGRDHTTVIHAVEKIKGLIRSDKQVFEEVTTLSKQLRKS